MVRATNTSVRMHVSERHHAPHVREARERIEPRDSTSLKIRQRVHQSIGKRTKLLPLHRSAARFAAFDGRKATEEADAPLAAVTHVKERWRLRR